MFTARHRQSPRPWTRDLAFTKQVVQDRDGIGKVDDTTAVGIAPQEALESKPPFQKLSIPLGRGFRFEGPDARYGLFLQLAKIFGRSP